MKFENLLSPIQVGNLTVNNRIVMAPMGVNLQEHDGSVSSELIDYFEERAKGEIGLIISPFAAVDDKQRMFSLGAYSDRMRPRLNRLAETVRAYGSKFFLQIAHYGGKAHQEVTGIRPVAPSSISSDLYKDTPRELSSEEIGNLVDKFVQTARRAKLAGFDGVELHGGHTYLVGEFVSPHTNRRNDKYGGTFKKRMRFPKEIVEGIKEVCGDDFPIGFKFSVHEHLENGVDFELGKRIANYMEKLGVVYLHVSSTASTMSSYVECDYPSVPSLYSNYPLIELAEFIKNSGVSVPVIGTGGINDPLDAEKIIIEGKADMLALGRALLAEPHWVRKIKKNEEIRPCIRCNVCHQREVLDRKEIRCTVNPQTGRESKYKLSKAKSPQKIIVIGAGPAGLEASLTASERGHRVLLFEAKKEIGGRMLLGSIPPFKKDLKKLIEYYKNRLSNSQVKLELDRKGSAEIISKESPDAVIIATGGKPIIPDVPGINGDNVLTVVDFYENVKPVKKGEIVAVLGAGPIGSETAWYLSLNSCSVKLIDILPLDEILADEHPTNRSALLKNLRKQGVEILDERELLEVNGNYIKLKNHNGSEESHQVDKLIIAIGIEPESGIKKQIENKGLDCEVYVIGDSRNAEDIYNAIHDGAHIARQL